MSLAWTILTVGMIAVPTDDAPLTLVAGGKTAYAVIIANDATETEKHAAAELVRFLREISGAEFPLVTASEPRTEGEFIAVGPGAAAGILGKEAADGLGNEGYVIRTKGRALAISGSRPRGTIYGVYSFLEDELGCRWFTPEVSRIPRRDTIVLRPIDRRFSPVLEARSTDYPNSRDADWAVRNKINGTQTAIDAKRGGKIAYGPFVHTFNAILDPAEHFEKHPEYFSEIQGKRTADHTQLCLTNPEVLKIAIEKVRAWMRSSPDATIFSVSQNDWYNFCTCKACSMIMAEEGSPMGPYLRFVNAIAEAVRGEFPDKAVDTLAYQFTRKPPLHAKPLPEVIVRLCSIECCFTHPLVARREVDAANADFARDLEAWGRLSRRLYIWDYVIDYAHSIMPFPNLYSIQPNIRFFVENGVRGIYEEANYFSRGGELAELRTWIMAKTLWNPDYDTDRAIDEFLDGYYEEAAFPLRRYLDLLHGKAKMDMVHLHIFDGPGSPLFSEDVLARAEALFDEAEAAVATKPEALHRVRTARLPVTYVRIAHLIPRLDAPNGKTVEGLARLRGLFESFDATARKERVTMVSEGRGYENWASSTKAALARTAAGIPAPEGAAVQLYIWTQEYARASKRMEDHFVEVLDATKRAGFDDIQGWLSSYATDESAARFGALLRERGMTQRAAYTGGAMHTEEGAKAAIESIVAAAGRGGAYGLQVVVMNPDVVGREKTDEELAVQTRNLDRLGEGLRALGIRLAIHTHDPEMRSEAREWYHILRNTDPEKVFFCLDLHWVYRGKQDPYRLLQDAGKRVIDLHLRNSTNGIWSEELSDGDIDHARVREILEAMGYRGLCTVELAQEGATKTTRPLEENLKRSRDYLRRVLGR